ncbi:MAG TPA: GMC oxidoreductase, partial [Gemmatimonadaceae bacterium]|nr:GMC oxidoreductase [Gemmatimonadaceae bacterium]
MELDARSVTDGSTMDTDVCVIGAGPAGLTVARELAGDGVEVVVLESGAIGHDDDAQRLNEGRVEGDPYVGLRETRHRQVGGMSHIWNTVVGGRTGWAKHAPLDAQDFAVDDADGWPFDRAHLEPFYHRAQELCGVAGSWDAACATGGDHHTFDFPAGALATGLYRFGHGERWTGRYLHELRPLRNLRLVYGATAMPFAMDVGSNGARVALVPVAANGARFAVRARRLVLACGAVETARLLLATAAIEPRAPWREHGQAGRWFVEHPRDFALTLEQVQPAFLRAVEHYDARAISDGSVVGARVGPSPALLAAGSLNFGISVLPLARPGVIGRLRTRWSGVAARQPGYGWSAVSRASAFERFRLIVNLEQRPNVFNRVALDTARDRHGVPRPVLHWRWGADEASVVERLREQLRDWFAEARLGAIRWEPYASIDPGAHHHAGTARMHPDPRYGVVDANGQVHGT